MSNKQPQTFSEQRDNLNKALKNLWDATGIEQHVLIPFLKGLNWLMVKLIKALK